LSGVFRLALGRGQTPLIFHGSLLIFVSRPITVETGFESWYAHQFPAIFCGFPNTNGPHAGGSPAKPLTAGILTNLSKPLR